MSGQNRKIIAAAAVLLAVCAVAAAVLLTRKKKQNAQTPEEVSRFLQVYRKRKLSAFRRENRRAEKGQLVFVGDSIIDHGQLKKYYGFDNIKIYNRGIGGDTVEGLTKRLDESIFDLEPAYIVFLMGINDIYTGRTNGELLGSYELVFSQIRERLPDVKVLVQSVYPIVGGTAAEPHPYNVRIAEINGELKALCGKYSFVYADTDSVLTAEDGISMQPELVSDGLHPNDRGKRRIADYLNPLIREMIG